MIGRRSNGQFAANPPTLDAELAAVEREISVVEKAGPPLEVRVAEVELELERAAADFRMHGFSARGVTAGEQLNYLRQAVVGGFVALVGKDELLAAERVRIERHFEAAGGVGYRPSEKAERLATLQQRRHRILAKHELLLRQQEGSGELIPDPRRDAALFLMDGTDLQAIADGQETA